MEEEFLEKAKENLKAAQLLFDNALYNATANRAYYAAFHAATAALAAAGISSQTSHDAVQAEFNGKLIGRRKIYPGYLSSYLPNLQSARNDADYSSKQISQKVASRLLAKAEQFVTAVEKEITP